MNNMEIFTKRWNKWEIKSMSTTSRRKNTKKISYNNIKNIRYQVGIKTCYLYNIPSQCNTQPSGFLFFYFPKAQKNYLTTAIVLLFCSSKCLALNFFFHLLTLFKPRLLDIIPTSLKFFLL